MCVCVTADVAAGPDSFVEKLAANVIKNLQVHITDIHMRYEDAFTNPAQPFSVGVTLKELRFQVCLTLSLSCHVECQWEAVCSRRSFVDVCVCVCVRVCARVCAC